MRKLFAGLCLGVGVSLSAAPLLADEAWDSNFGPVIWEADFGDTAVLMLEDTESGRIVRLYVDGLAADVMGGRGAYQGIWIASAGDEACTVQVVGPDGFKSNQWGQFVITFVGEDFPSDWAGVYGTCLETPTNAVTAVAR